MFNAYILENKSNKRNRLKFKLQDYNKKMNQQGHTSLLSKHYSSVFVTHRCGMSRLPRRLLSCQEIELYVESPGFTAENSDKI